MPKRGPPQELEQQSSKKETLPSWCLCGAVLKEVEDQKLQLPSERRAWENAGMVSKQKQSPLSTLQPPHLPLVLPRGRT